MIYHLTTKPEWQQAQESGVYIPQAFATDGFIHCSDHYQIRATANRFYKDTPELIVLEITPDQLTAELVYENLEGGQMTFPHLYGPLPLEAVVQVFELVREPDGSLSLPPEQHHPDPELFSELLFGLPGRAFRSPTPGSYLFDSEERVLPYYFENKIDTVVVLSPEDELRRNSGRDLLRVYRDYGLNVLHAPVEDFSAPPKGAWDEALKETRKLLEQGKNLVIHCHAGLGRTGMFAACLAQDVLGVAPNEAVAWVRKFIPYAVDTHYQQQFVREYKQ